MVFEKIRTIPNAPLIKLQAVEVSISPREAILLSLSTYPEKTTIRSELLVPFPIRPLVNVNDYRRKTPATLLSHYAYFILDLNGHPLQYQLGTFSGPSANYQYPLPLDKRYSLRRLDAKKDKSISLLGYPILFFQGMGVFLGCKLDGTPASLPLIPDKQDPTDRVTWTDEFGAHGSKSILAKNGNYFSYSSVLRKSFLFMIWCADLDLPVPNWQGETINVSFMDLLPNSGAAFLSIASQEADTGKIGSLLAATRTAWHDHAEEFRRYKSLVGLGFLVTITSDVSYCFCTNQNNVDPNNSQVRFFASKLPSLLLTIPILPLFGQWTKQNWNYS